MDTNSVLVSIIVPVYNGALYIEKCLNSLVSQTYKPLEIIIVNDGSIDDTEKICTEYQRKYHNIELICKSNEGVTIARLVGVRKAKGRYISFVDADDWIDDDYISFMMESIGDADIVLGGISRILVNEDNRVVEERNNIKPGIYEGENQLISLYEKMLCYEMPFKVGILPYACNKIYRKELLLPFMEKVDKRINDGEDAAILFPYLIAAKKVVLSDYCGYRYLIRNGSACNSKKIDAYNNAACLYGWLYECFRNNKYSDILLPQLRNYFLKMIWKRDPAGYLEINDFVFPFERITKGSDVILYGAGDMGRAYYIQIKQTSYCNIVAWADENVNKSEEINYQLISPKEISNYHYDYIIIAINSRYLCEQIGLLFKNEGIAANKIIYKGC